MAQDQPPGLVRLVAHGHGPDADMSAAQTPAQAAAWPVRLVLGDLAPETLAAYYGELVQFGTVIPWQVGIPVPHRATTGERRA